MLLNILSYLASVSSSELLGKLEMGHVYRVPYNKHYVNENKLVSLFYWYIVGDFKIIVLHDI